MDTPAPPPIETVEISRLFCSPTNPRRNDVAVPHVAASLRRFGWQQPIVARPSGEVVAGNTRLKAAQELGMANSGVARITERVERRRLSAIQLSIAYDAGASLRGGGSVSA